MEEVVSSAGIVLQKSRELRSQGHCREARELLEKHISLFPNEAELHALLGQICEQMGDHSNAICYLENALLLEPHLLDALFTLGVACQMSGNPLRAIELLEKIVEAVPTLPQSYYYIGLALRDLEKAPEAKAAFEHALALDPSYAECMGGLADLLFWNYHFDAAEALLLRALELNPKLNDVKNNLARLSQLEGKGEDALVIFRELFGIEPDNRGALSNLLYSLCYLDSLTPEMTAAEHISLCTRFFQAVPPPGPFKMRCFSSEDSRLRIGYLSNDFCLHSVSFFLEPILINHDRSRFRIYCYTNRTAGDDTTLRMRSLDLLWRDISNLSAEDAAGLIERDEVDILVDLSGHTGKNRMDVCALKPAPVMATWIGYPHTTGMKQFDYYISDNLCAPSGITDHLFCEKVWRLPRIFSCYLPPTEFPPVSSAPVRKNGYITFGSFNNLAKVSDTTIALWSEVMKRVPDARLFIKSASLGGNTARKRLIEHFDRNGITEDRLILMVHTPTPLEHLGVYADIDIALDTYPYHGTTTTCEALWMGVPVITLAGCSHLSRVGVSLLTNVECSELVAESTDGFVEIAASLACDRERIYRYRSSLRGAMANSPLMDSAGVTKDVEEAFTTMFDRYIRATEGRE